MEDKDIRKIARKRVEFRDHLSIYVLLNAIFIIINMLFSPGFMWFIFITLFWGIGLLFHWRDAYYGDTDIRIEKEFQKLKKERSFSRKFKK